MIKNKLIKKIKRVSKFEPLEHIYKIEQFFAPSVTTILKEITPNSELEAYKKYKNAATYGTEIHKLIENYINKEININKLKMRNKPFFNILDGFINSLSSYLFNKNTKEIKIFSECDASHPLYLYGGTADGVIIDSNKKYHLFDIKTGIAHPIRHTLQLLAYREAIQYNNNIKINIDNISIFYYNKINKNWTVKPIEKDLSFLDFKIILDFYRLKQKIK